jgi:cystathionine beta-lyase
LRATAYQLGQVASPDDCWLGSRGLRTMGVRLAQHQASALQIARWLSERAEVARVLHPALPSCPGHDLFGIGFSWGGYESLAVPADPARALGHNDTPGAIVRLHIGLEDPADLIADLDRGFAAFAEARR